METDRGGWIVIQRRVPNGRVNFYQRWKDYEDGFGDLDSEFWYGLQNLHCLTTQQNVELRIDLQDKQGNKVSWVYQQFSVDGPDQKYRLHIGQGTGTRGSFNAMAGTDNMSHTLALLIVTMTYMVETVQCHGGEHGGTTVALCKSEWSA